MMFTNYSAMLDVPEDVRQGCLALRRRMPKKKVLELLGIGHITYDAVVDPGGKVQKAVLQRIRGALATHSIQGGAK